MPFTLSHAAAVLPAVRRDGTGHGPLLPAVLVAGSFAPDMPFYAASVLPGGMEFGAVTHAFAGVVTVDVLIAWVLVGLWLLVREPLLALLPRPWQGRPAELLRCGAARARVRAAAVGWWYVCAVLGALTHVVWDAFTHDGRWGTRLIPAIERDRLLGVPLFTWLQYGSSVAGAAVVAVFVVRALRRLPGREQVGVPVLSVRDRWWAGAVIGGCAVAGAVQRVAAEGAGGGGPVRLWDLVPALCFGAGAGLVPGLLLYAAGVRVWRRSPAPPAGHGGPGEQVAADEGRSAARAR
ncbi:DUF4184 family protein [Streptomyces camelliae]|uniref:DUF4184 family protein n=1 Tax=Streptomyces camelliae TaxID=3004093 RepID=A0ABY7PBM6_9ACTN|nr:DUF4184 family protein [Streptomyces sp. HUAS 2-6]WBO66977.1 DUF4184 family protein [Streptomyces sp. HUAS 2-6]